MSACAPPPPFRTRTNVLFASQSPLAVVHRTGPRRHHQLLLWDTKSDTFTPGQWMKGLVRLWDLSPDGSKLIYWAAQYHASAPRHSRRILAPDGDETFDPLATPAHVVARFNKRYPKRKLPLYMTGGKKLAPPPREIQGVWTAVSNPPYFSALAIWPCLGHWTGGGYFASNHDIVIYEPESAITPISNSAMPSNFKTHSFVASGVMKPSADQLARNPRHDPDDTQRAVAAALVRAGAKFVDWTRMTPLGDILFACDGSIYRHTGVPSSIGPNLLSDARRLVDLSANRFELIRPPAAAMRW